MSVNKCNWWLDLGGALHALQRIDGQLRLVPPKSNSSIRAIPIPDVAMHALKRHQIRQEEEARAAGCKWTESGFVFTTSIGTPLDGDNVTKRFKRLLREAGIRDQRFHDLRHCCGTLLVAQGVHPRVVMEILGHSQISVTMNTYV
ncbi:MAG: site-specific integrase, partial [Actinobacteria bacterium]|nr:site-specific integrase [Actinomycetota bacterium]